MEDEEDGDTNCNWCTWNDPLRLSKMTGGVRNWRMSWDQPKYGINEVG